MTGIRDDGTDTKNGGKRLGTRIKPEVFVHALYFAQQLILSLTVFPRNLVILLCAPKILMFVSLS